MKPTFKLALLLLISCHPALGDVSEELVTTAESDIAIRFASNGLEGMRDQLRAPGKSDAEKEQIIMAAVHELAKCYVSSSIEFADRHSLSAASLLRWQAGWELTEADRDTMTRLDEAAFRESQIPCKKTFLDALPMQVG